MPTLVAQHEKKTYHSSFIPKHPYKLYETRTNSAPQTTSANHKTNLIKVDKPASSKDSTEKRGVTKSSVGKEETPESTPVTAHASTDSSPLHDVCQRPIHYDPSTNMIRKVLSYVSNPALHKNRMEFRGVGAREFGSIEEILSATSRFSTKPRQAICS
ncbi:hypothetical protein DEU56DRAFT_918148 [Suillus clintonianus]|uniref:uncharacterized protein n=1 Tax=Suillus clintonianus TaxID=1904413 RepID=UPI001B86D15A|nr:uncharacterized protein DEU56DRAFT_918148 [Suillus clintonianus]KAG2121631.1 hypothetical protein DEU56DRAFT_918148 [Suillus clintonianus]